MSLPGWMVVVTSVTAMLAVYVLFMVPLDERLPFELKTAETEAALRDVAIRYRRLWAVLTAASFLVGTAVTLALAELARDGASAHSAPGFDTIGEYVFVLVLIGIAGLGSGWVWAGTRIGIARLIAAGLDREPMKPERVRSVRRWVAGLLFAGTTMIALLIALLAAAEIMPAAAVTGAFIGLGSSGVVVAIILWVTLRVRRDRQEILRRP